MKIETGLSVRILSADILGSRGLEALLSSSNWEVVQEKPYDALLVDWSVDIEPKWNAGDVPMAPVGMPSHGLVQCPLGVML